MIDLIQEIVRLESLCFPGPWTEEMIRGELSKPGTILLFAQDENTQVVAGNSETKVDSCAGYLVGASLPDFAELLRVCVDPRLRARGIAGRLMNALERNVQSRILLEVAETNTSAIRLYKSCGFEIIAHRKEYYRDGTDCLVMEKSKVGT